MWDWAFDIEITLTNCSFTRLLEISQVVILPCQKILYKLTIIFVHATVLKYKKLFYSLMVVQTVSYSVLF